MEHTALTLLITELNHLLDTGKYDDITIEEVHEHIDSGTILQFLRERAGDDIFLLSALDCYTDFEDFYVKYLQRFYGAYPGHEYQKYGVKNNGLCLLIAWTNQIIQEGSGWRPKQDMIEVNRQA